MFFMYTTLFKLVLTCVYSGNAFGLQYSDAHWTGTAAGDCGYVFSRLYTTPFKTTLKICSIRSFGLYIQMPMVRGLLLGLVGAIFFVYRNAIVVSF